MKELHPTHAQTQRTGGVGVVEGGIEKHIAKLGPSQVLIGLDPIAEQEPFLDAPGACLAHSPPDRHLSQPHSLHASRSSRVPLRADAARLGTDCARATTACGSWRAGSAPSCQRWAGPPNHQSPVSVSAFSLLFHSAVCCMCVFGDRSDLVQDVEIAKHKFVLVQPVGGACQHRRGRPVHRLEGDLQRPSRLLYTASQGSMNVTMPLGARRGHGTYGGGARRAAELGVQELDRIHLRSPRTLNR